MTSFDESYINVLKRILDNGSPKQSRAGKTLSVFNDTIVAEDAEGWEGFPISNLRKIHWRGAIIETLWMLGVHRKSKDYADLPITNVKFLQDNGVNYWNPWADGDGNLGPVYGEQLVRWKSVDGHRAPVMEEEDSSPLTKTINQVERIISLLRNNPDDRRLVCTMWNPGELTKMALPPCHHTHEYYSRVGKDGKRYLDIRWIQRSCDMPIGIPYNVLQYTILDKIVALCTGHVPGKVYGCLGDCHIYENQIEAVRELVRRWESGEVEKCTTPSLKISHHLIGGKNAELYEDFAIDGSDFKVENYNPLPPVKIAVSV